MHPPPVRETNSEKTMSTTATPPKGLEGIVAANSSICYIDGDAGVLAYRGIAIHELADNSTYEETCYLLWFGKLPTRAQLADLNQRLAAERNVAPTVFEIMHQLPKSALPMEVLRTCVSAHSAYDPDTEKMDHDSNVTKAIRLTSQIAIIVAGYDRIRKGKNVVQPDASLSHAANFLLMLNGEKPTPTAEKALDVALILHAVTHLSANVDFYSASTYSRLRSDVYLFTPIFAVSRISGCTAHVIEQLDDNRLIRPRAEYMGPKYPNHYVPMERR